MKMSEAPRFGTIKMNDAWIVFELFEISFGLTQ
jgi:hypothetical protein